MPLGVGEAHSSMSDNPDSLNSPTSLTHVDSLRVNSIHHYPSMEITRMHCPECKVGTIIEAPNVSEYANEPVCNYCGLTFPS
jgi:transposase-like protein